jgi:hypothetical protein
MGHGLVAWAHPRVDSSVSSLLIQAEPVGASIAAWVFLDERVSFVQGLAMLVVLTALGWLAFREARDARGALALDEAVASVRRRRRHPGNAKRPGSLAGTGPSQTLVSADERDHSPRTRLMMSVAIAFGTSMYCANCIVYVARPWVRERRSVE